MRIGSLFSGAGGLDMAVEAVFGGEVIWQSELDKAASKVLAYRFPCAPNLGDITQIDWTEVETPDVLCGGFPCQDVSAAGKRAGIKDGTRSGLWAVFADAIDALRPQYVVIENVRGLLSAQAHRNVEPANGTMGDGTGGPVLRAAGAVLGDLADLGYDAQWATVAAADAGAPHNRERVFVLAVSSDASGAGKGEGLPPVRVSAQPGRSVVVPADSSGYDFGPFDPLVRRWETLTRPAPNPLRWTGFAAYISPEFGEWMMGWPTGWVTDPDIGISRSDQLRIIGNGVVPQQASAALHYLLQIAEVAA